MASLNQKHLDSLKHQDDKRTYSRIEKGLRLVVGQKPSKLKSWELTYYLHGHKRRYVFGHYPTDYTLAEARTERDNLKSQVRKGICPKEQAESEVRQQKLSAQQKTTFAQLRERYDTEHLIKNGRKSRNEIIRVLKTKFSAWDNYEPTAINRMMVVERLDQIEKDGPVMRNRAHSHLRSMFRFAIEKSIITENPATNIRQLTEQPKTRCLTADEILYFWNEVSEQSFRPATVIALRLMLITGQRGGEILSMKPEHVKGDWWTQPETKNGRVHKTYLTPRAKVLIEEAIALSANKHYVFGSGQFTHTKITTLSKAVLRWRQRKENPMTIDAFTPHDLRRTMASNLGNMEVDRFTQDQILNHVDNSIGGVYDVSQYDRLKERTMPLWETRLTSIINQQQQDNIVLLHG